MLYNAMVVLVGLFILLPTGVYLNLKFTTPEFGVSWWDCLKYIYYELPKELL